MFRVLANFLLFCCVFGFSCSDTHSAQGVFGFWITLLALLSGITLGEAWEIILVPGIKYYLSGPWIVLAKNP